MEEFDHFHDEDRQQQNVVVAGGVSHRCGNGIGPGGAMGGTAVDGAPVTPGTGPKGAIGAPGWTGGGPIGGANGGGGLG